MKTYGKIRDVINTGDGVLISFLAKEIGNPESLDDLARRDRVEIEITKEKKRRSLNANAYFWVLVDSISKKLRMEREAVYLAQLFKYGSFVDAAVIDEAIPVLRETYRYVSIMETGNMNEKPASVCRCFRGSSTYTIEEMSDLINGTVDDAKELGIDVMPPSEVEHMTSVWKGAFYE